MAGWRPGDSFYPTLRLPPPPPPLPRTLTDDIYSSFTYYRLLLLVNTGVLYEDCGTKSIRLYTHISIYIYPTQYARRYIHMDSMHLEAISTSGAKYNEISLNGADRQAHGQRLVTSEMTEKGTRGSVSGEGRLEGHL